MMMVMICDDTHRWVPNVWMGFPLEMTWIQRWQVVCWLKLLTPPSNFLVL